jgi:GNAT superfamily N-acetyltransferase
MIRLLQSSDVAAFVALRRRALLDAPLAFGASPEDDFAAAPDALLAQMQKAPDWVIAGAFDETLVGAAGLLRDRHLKAAHKAHVWGMFVQPEARGRGIGRALLDALVAHARTLDGVTTVRLAVSDAAPEARRLYERAGFQAWGFEPDALRAGGVTAGEHHMLLRL